MSNLKIDLQKSFQSLFKASIRNTKFHGLPLILRTKRPSLRIIWLVCFLVSFTYCFYSVTDLISLYFKYRVVTSIKFFNTSPFEFPAVTLCSSNIISTSDILLGCKFKETDCLSDFSESTYKRIGLPDYYCTSFNVNRITPLTVELAIQELELVLLDRHRNLVFAVHDPHFYPGSEKLFSLLNGIEFDKIIYYFHST